MRRQILTLTFAAIALFTLTKLLHSQAPPAPTIDRITFNAVANYKATFKKLLTFDRPDNGQIRVIWGNDLAANANPWDPYPYGSILLFESFSSKRDPSGASQLDDNGRLVPDTLTALFVQMKSPGFGEAYGPNRNGEWEYVTYRPDGSTQTAPSASAGCAICHLDAGAQNDYVFRREMFVNSSGAIPTATMSRYKFVPGDMTIKKGQTVTWYNDDQVQHQIFSPGGGFNSDHMRYGASFSQKFDKTGDFEIRCSVHPGMRAKVTVTE